jgi:hypothetical protein
MIKQLYSKFIEQKNPIRTNQWDLKYLFTKTIAQ